MAEDLEKKVADLEEKLNKARIMYKEQKEELEKTKNELKVLQNSGEKDDTSLQKRIKELENEIIINGSSSEEIKTLNMRLDKAKEVYAAQKDEILRLNAEKTELIEKNKTITEELEGQIKILDEIRTLVNC